jgi:hypothetical protein
MHSPSCCRIAILAGALSFGAFASSIDPNYITGPIDLTVGDVALIPPFGEQIVNPPYGIAPPPAPNGVYQLSQISGLGTPGVSDLFRSSATGGIPNGTNVDFAGPGAVQYGLRAGPSLGLVPGDHIAALSYGFDGLGPFPTELIFSVDPDALGAPGTAVRAQAVLNQAAGGLYVTGTFAPFGLYEGTPFVPPLNNINNNLQILVPADVGLVTGKIDLPKQSRPGSFEDDLTDVELEPGLTNGDVYFALDQFSPTVVELLNGPIYSSDLLVSPGNNTFAVFRNHALLGLGTADMIDALALSLTANEALFSLAPGSPALLAGFSAADVFITDFDGTFHLFATAGQLGLLATDNLNALDTAPPTAIPEPAALIETIAGLALFWMGTRRRRRGAEGAPLSAGKRRRSPFAVRLACITVLAFTGRGIAQVNVPAGAGTQNETSITVLPNNVAIVGYNTDGASASGFGVSNAGAGAWPNVGAIPLPAPFMAAGDPAVDINTLGQAFYAMISSIGNHLAGIFVAPSFAPFPIAPPFWQPAVPVLIALDDNVDLDKEYIAIDRNSLLPSPNGSRDNIYVSFTRFGPGRDDIQFSRSTNLGLLYSRPVTISETLNQARAGDYRQVSVPAAGINSNVFVAWSEALNINAPGKIQIQHSTDAGRSFPLNLPPQAAPVDLVEFKRPLGNGSAMVHGTVPTMAVNTVGGFAGQVYVAYADRRNGQLDIFFNRDAGGGFAAVPVRINSLPATLANDQFMPWMAINSQGVIAVIFYSKLDNVTPLAQVDAVCSADGGVTWTQDFTISGAQIINTNTPGFQGQIRFGEYIGVAANGNTFFAAWTADNPVSGNQNIYTQTFVCPNGPFFSAQPVPSDVASSGDQVIPITTTSTLAAAAFQSPAGTPAPEVITANLPARTLAQSFPLVAQPLTDVVIAPDGQHAAVMDGGGFSILNLAANTSVRVPLSKFSPTSEISITPDSANALIALSTPVGQSTPEPSPQEVSIFNLSTAVRRSVQLPQFPLSGITITPDSSKAFITAGTSVQAINIAAGTTVSVPLPETPNTGIVLTPNGAKALVAAGHSVVIIDVAALTTTTVAIPNQARTDIVVTADGTHAVVATAVEVDIINIAAASNLAVPLNSAPFTGLDVTPDSTKAVIRDSAGAHIITLATGAQTIVALAGAANAPFTNAVITPDGTRAVFGDSVNLDVITLATSADLKIAINSAPVIAQAVTPNSQLAVFGTANHLNAANLTTGALTTFALATGETPLTCASISPDGTRAAILTNTGMELLDLTDLTKSSVLLNRTPRLPELNFLPDDGQPPLPPFAERGVKGGLDGR